MLQGIDGHIKYSPELLRKATLIQGVKVVERKKHVLRLGFKENLKNTIAMHI
jgi:hypothetical protein